MKRKQIISALSLALILPACASFDAQDHAVLGNATRTNIAAHSARDVDLPNSKKVEGASGVRAVKAVKALNDGQTKQLASTGTGGAE